MARLSEVERNWFVKKLGGANPTDSLNDVKRRYYISVIGGASANVRYLDDLEKQWVRSVIVVNGATPSGKFLGDLWKQLNASAGVRVSRNLDENKLNYYLAT